MYLNILVTLIKLPVIFDVLIELSELFQLENDERKHRYYEKQRGVNPALNKYHGFKIVTNERNNPVRNNIGHRQCQAQRSDCRYDELGYEIAQIKATKPILIKLFYGPF